MTSYELPVPVETRLLTSPGVKIEYPVITVPDNPKATHAINHAILQLVRTIQHDQLKLMTGTSLEMIGSYEIKTNERGLLSLLVSNYAYSSPMAHGNTIAKSLTFDVNTGRAYSLGELFKPGSDYVKALSALIAAQIKARDLPLLDDGFQAIKPNQDYYLADKALVVYFQLYEITPYYVGLPMFPINVYDLLSIAADPGPLASLSVAVI
ncbi:DUF3298 and DUF4163 domain-containing protein [Paenibacillus koleovorans]|uniref:DUF3298 and DUF4163 domain-containing protein n=1 Tax=Paenibacillus koleovorans TaxID=121608 RepID=UPI000FDA3062|nr:DUF3298 and DUF4163 domain-containing protein [Paenibacillus koleovorans]